MSWKTKRVSFMVQRPDLTTLLDSADAQVQAGLREYNDWCGHFVQIRSKSVALLFFLVGIALVLFVNLLLYVVSNKSFAYCSLWSVLDASCVVASLAIDLYVRTQTVNVQGARRSALSVCSSYSYIVSYPICLVVCCSMYCKWMQLPFNVVESSSVPSSESQDLALFITRSSIAFLALYGIVTIYRNQRVLHFESLQATRSIFLKQTVLRILVCNIIQSITGCVCIMMCWCFFLQLDWSEIWSISSVLFQIIYNVNLLLLLSHSVQNRLWTEKTSMSDTLFDYSTNARCIDTRLLALTHIGDAKHAQYKQYFAHLALVELLDVVQFDEKQRKKIYSTQLYFNLLVATLLAELCSFVIDLYEYVYAPAKIANRNQITNGPVMKRLWYTRFTLSSEVDELFEKHKSLMHCADILSFLVIHSLDEDELGTTQESLEQILCVLLESLDMLDIFIKSNMYRCLHPNKQHNEIIDYLYKGIEAAVLRIAMSMYNYLETMSLPQKNAQRLQTYLDQASRM